MWYAKIKLRHDCFIGNRCRKFKCKSAGYPLEGYFELWSPQEARKPSSPIAVRHESFVAGNDYVGKQAALDNGFITQTYLTMLEGWTTHLMNFELDVYQDYYDGKKTESQLWAQVENITKHLL